MVVSVTNSLAKRAANSNMLHLIQAHSALCKMPHKMRSHKAIAATATYLRCTSQRTPVRSNRRIAHSAAQQRLFRGTRRQFGYRSACLAVPSNAARQEIRLFAQDHLIDRGERRAMSAETTYQIVALFLCALPTTDAHFAQRHGRCDKERCCCC